MDIFDRVRSLAKREGISLSALEQELGYSNGSLYPHSENATIRGDRVAELAKYFNVTTDWLLTGESPDRFTYDEWVLLDKYRGLDDESRQNIINFVNFIEQQKHKLKKQSDNNSGLEKAE